MKCMDAFGTEPITDQITLFHGSKGCFVGDISPFCSRVECDFGQGFYVGDQQKQAETIVIDANPSIIYKLSVSLNNLSVYKFDDDRLWALYVGINRGLLQLENLPKLNTIVKHINSHDVIIGLIADDRMMYIYNAFINGDVTDIVLKECLKEVQLGNQYVFKTEKSCKQIKIQECWELSKERKKVLKHDKSVVLGNIGNIVEEIKLEHRREGLFIDELLKSYQ